MDSIEISDPDGDALTITTHADGVWITCTHGAHEVTVGPLVAGDLHEVLAQIAGSTRAASVVTAHSGAMHAGDVHAGSAHGGEKCSGLTRSGPAHNRG